MKGLFTVLFIFTSLMVFSQRTIIVSLTGNDLTGLGTLSNPYRTMTKAATVAFPGDTVKVRAGTYNNEKYNDGDIWTGDFLDRIECNGTANALIYFKPYNNEQVILKFDGAYALLIQNSSYVHITGFIIEGINDQITYNEAIAEWGTYRDPSGVIHHLEQEMNINITDPKLIGQTLPKPPTIDAEKPIYYNGRGIVANKSHHIYIDKNTLRKIPASAIRAQQSDYVYITNNLIYENTYWTTLGVGAITVAEAQVLPAGDTYTGEKIIIENNIVYQNENRMFSWNPTKLIVTFEIDEGTGIFLTRNKDTYTHGRMRISNNLSFLNGASGIICHFTDRVMIDHNSLYKNGTTNHGLPGGIGVNTSSYVSILNNISYARNTKWAIGITAGATPNLVVADNVVYNENSTTTAIHRLIPAGWINRDPKYISTAANNFKLNSTSEAIDLANTATQIYDILKNVRDNKSDAGAHEYCIHNPIVTNTNDNGVGSLRYMVYKGCSNDTITFSAAISMDTIKITSGPIALNKNLFFKGSGITKTIISGNLNSRIFDIENPITNIKIADLTLTLAKDNNAGGAIFNNGNLTMANVLLLKNYKGTTPNAISNFSKLCILPPGVTIKN